jgi:4-amino-4-deoxy-L-arabinose transferase-like glycosyltransferase
MIARARALIWPSTVARRFLSVLLLLFTLQQLLIVLIFPPFSGHDEVAHFDYVRLLAQEHRLPEIPELEAWRIAMESGEPPPGDFIRPDLYAYCLFTLEWWPCAPDDPNLASNPPYQTTDAGGERFPIAWQYAANHPPLFYALAAPVQALVDGQGLGLQNRILRMLLIPFGLLVVSGTFALARQVSPKREFVPIAAATFVAFQPQLAYSAAILNNDVTVIAVGAWILTLLLMGLRTGFARRSIVALGLLFGAGLLFKGTAIVFAPLIALAIVLRYGWRDVRNWMPKGAAVAAIGFGIASPWYLHLWRTYGSLDALDRVEQLQSFWNYPDGAPGFFSLLSDGEFVTRFWRELWGGFGWRRIPFEDGLLWAIGAVCAVSAIGLALDLRRVSLRAGASRDHVALHQRIVLIAMVLISYLAVIQFGTTFELAQARYAFAAMPAVAVLLALGLSALTPATSRRFVLVGWVAANLALTIFVYSAYVIPYWYLGEPR